MVVVNFADISAEKQKEKKRILINGGKTSLPGFHQTNDHYEWIFLKNSFFPHTHRLHFSQTVVCATF